nr:putative cysteine-rich receptor-like protein kinase 43 [Quercus suber]
MWGLIFEQAKKKKKIGGEEESKVLGTQLRWFPGMPREFKYKNVKKATNNFHESTGLGQSGYIAVYKGILEDKDHKTNTEIAIKKFYRDNIQSKDDFLILYTAREFRGFYTHNNLRDNQPFGGGPHSIRDFETVSFCLKGQIGI